MKQRILTKAEKRDLKFEEWWEKNRNKLTDAKEHFKACWLAAYQESGRRRFNDETGNSNNLKLTTQEVARTQEG